MPLDDGPRTMLADMLRRLGLVDAGGGRIAAVTATPAFATEAVA
jgi:hypothetical protein